MGEKSDNWASLQTYLIRISVGGVQASEFYKVPGGDSNVQPELRTNG